MENDYGKGVKNVRLLGMSVLTALAVGIMGYIMAEPSTAYATVNDFFTKTNEETGEEELWYKVQEGDNASKISSFAVGYFIRQGEVPKTDREWFKEDENRRCGFWPGVVKDWLDYQNEQRKAEAEAKGKKKYTKVTKFRLHPGDEIKVAHTYLELILDNAEAKASPWFAKYLKDNHIYPKMRYIDIDLTEAKRRIQEVYRVLDPSNVHEISDEEAAAYLRGICGPNLKFRIKEGAQLDPDKDKVWQFYEQVLSPEEVQEIMDGKNSSMLLFTENGPTSENLTPEETHKILKRVNMNKRA